LTVTDNSTDGRPWPIDPIIQPETADPLPIPEWGAGGPPPAPTGGSNGDTTRPDKTAPPRSPGSPDDRSNPVTDHDRTVYGDLLDRAAERGLLNEHDYQIRLGELAEATSVDQMQRIVTELPAFTPTPATSAHPFFGGAEPVKVTHPGTVGKRRRSSPWLLLGIVVIVALVSLVWLALYADHVIRTHSSGVVTTSVVVRPLGGLRL
jgi:Domain of unknown function (DUF1707)